MKYLIFIIVAFFFLVFYQGLKDDPSFIPSNLLTKEIPNFSINSFSGSSLASKDLLEREVKILNFFASWCPPCRVEHKQLLELSKDTKIYGIAKKNKHEDLSKYLKELGNPYSKIGMDTYGEASIEWGVYGLPETFIIDGKGIVKYKHVGPLMKKDKKKIENILKQLK